jgi:hypothetical protein
MMSSCFIREAPFVVVSTLELRALRGIGSRPCLGP